MDIYKIIEESLENGFEYFSKKKMEGNYKVSNKIFEAKDHFIIIQKNFFNQFFQLKAVHKVTFEVLDIPMYDMISTYEGAKFEAESIRNFSHVIQKKHEAGEMTDKVFSTNY